MNEINNQEKFEVRDLRQKDQYITDDKFLNGYARFLGIYAVGVYGSLCRHANKGQRSWPSIRTMGEELGIGKNSILDAIKRMEFFQIVKKYHIGKMANNRYDLIRKQRWLPINEENLREYSEVCDINFTGLQDKLHRFVARTSNSKETQSKELKERRDLPYKKLKPYFRNMPIVISKGKRWCIPPDGSAWLEFDGSHGAEKQIEWK